MITLEKNMDTVKIFNQKTVKQKKPNAAPSIQKHLQKKLKSLCLTHHAEE
jgi:hypothetical protein